MATTEPQQTAPLGAQMSVEFVDHPDLAETFADSIQNIFFDGQTLRLDFCVTRLHEARPSTRPAMRRYPCCRLVLTPAAAGDLINKMQQVGAALAQARDAKAPAPPASEALNSQKAKK